MSILIENVNLPNEHDLFKLTFYTEPQLVLIFSLYPGIVPLFKLSIRCILGKNKEVYKLVNCVFIKKVLLRRNWCNKLKLNKLVVT